MPKKAALEDDIKLLKSALNRLNIRKDGKILKRSKLTVDWGTTVHMKIPLEFLSAFSRNFDGSHGVESYGVNCHTSTVVREPLAHEDLFFHVTVFRDSVRPFAERLKRLGSRINNEHKKKEAKNRP